MHYEETAIEKLTNSELSAEILNVKYGKHGVISFMEQGSAAKLISGDATYIFNSTSPCDMMQIIIENGISLIFNEGGFWMARNDKKRFTSISTNPLRAAACVFLMMNEGE